MSLSWRTALRGHHKKMSWRTHSDKQMHHMSQCVTKPTKWHVHPAKTQISLGICPVWSESLLSAWRKLGSLATHWVHNKDSDQTGQMPRLIWVFTWCTCRFVGFVMCWENKWLLKWLPCPYMVKTFKNLLQNQECLGAESLHKSSGMADLPKLLKWLLYIDNWPFDSKVKFASLCICMGPIHLYGKNV